MYVVTILEDYLGIFIELKIDVYYIYYKQTYFFSLLFSLFYPMTVHYTSLD